jgi:DNA-binding Xre family transcriptional regulator
MSKDRLEVYWNLNELLYKHKILKVTEFQQLLREHGVTLSYSQAHALVHDQPLRVTVRIIRAICEMLECSVGDLLVLRKATDKSPKEARISEEKKITRLKPHQKKLIGRKLKFD